MLTATQQPACRMFGAIGAGFEAPPLFGCAVVGNERSRPNSRHVPQDVGTGDSVGSGSGSRTREMSDATEERVDEESRSAQLQVSRATNPTSSSFCLLIGLRSARCLRRVDAKPHCGLSASRSSGTIAGRLAMRAFRPAAVSIRGVFELTSPRTTTRSSGRWRSGSNVPDRASSYSSRKRWKCARPNTFCRDPVVAAGRVEHALVIAAADVDAERHAGMALDDRVVQLDGGVEHPIGIAAALAVALANRLVEQPGVLRRVDLDVLAAEPRQLGDLAAGEVDEVGEVGVARRVCAASTCRGRSRRPPAAR